MFTLILHKNVRIIAKIEITYWKVGAYTRHSKKERRVYIELSERQDGGDDVASPLGAT